MNRKLFLKKASTAFLVGIPILSLWNCSDDSEDDAMNPDDDEMAKNCVDNGTSSSIGGNHGHTLSVSKEDVSDGTTKTYDIRGSGSHSHEVTVTADHFNSLKSNDSVTVESTATGHTHSITITCA